VAFEAPVTKSTQIQTLREDPDPEIDRQALAVLIEEIEVRAQRFLSDEFAKIPGIRVVPFDETRRLLADLKSPSEPLTEVHLQSLGRQTGADHVVTGLIHDYGRVRWQYWVTGWLAHAVVELGIVGILSGWNPAALGAYAAIDLTTDMVIWYGGAEIFGWAFRPVRLHLDATQVGSCAGKIWSRDELVIRVPGERVEQYPEDQQHLKEVQLEANLRQAAEDAAAEAAAVLEVRPCSEKHEAKPLPSFSWASIFDLLL
jgi:hypothetical protein